MEELIEVTLINPAKIDGVRQPAGVTVSVTHGVAGQLADSGAIPPLSDLDDLWPDIEAALDAENAEFEQAVAEKAKEIAETVVKAAVDLAVDELAGQRDEAVERAETAEAKVASLKRQLAESTKPHEGNTLAAEDGSKPKAAAAKAPATKKAKPKSPAKAGVKR